MNGSVKFFALGLVVGLAPLVGVMSSRPKADQPVVESPQPSQPAPKATAGTAPSPSPSVSPMPQATSEQIYMWIEEYAQQYSVSRDVMRHVAMCESGFNPGAINGPYAGLFQFGESAWKSHRLALGADTDVALRLEAEAAVRTAAYALSLGRGKNLWPNCMPD